MGNLRDDSLFKGESFFFPVEEDDGPANAGSGFDAEKFKKAAREILSGSSAAVSRTAIGKKRKNWRRRRNIGFGAPL